MELRLWKNFSKRKNSTKQPDWESAIHKDVKLKQNTSIENPSFILDGIDFDYNYCLFAEHYYYIDDIRLMTNDLYEISCSQDLLATYKDAIAATSAYVLYDTSANSKNIIDSRLATTSRPTYLGQDAAFRSDLSAAGNFIVTLTGENKVGTYVVLGTQLDKLLPNIQDVFDSFIEPDDIFSAIKGSAMQLVSSGSVAENIKDVRWIPFNVPTTATVVGLKAGKYTLDITGGKVTDDRSLTETVGIDIPWQFDDWRRNDPYTQVYLYIPFVGLVNYPAGQLSNESRLAVTSSLDPVTGDLAIMVKAGAKVLGTYGASTGVTIPIGTSVMNPSNLLNSVIAGAASAVSGNAIGAVGAALTAITPMNQTVGGISSGCASGLELNLLCFTVTHNTTIEPSAISTLKGTPTDEVKTLNTAGYIQTMDASIAIDGLGRDKDAINALLNGGFYYE